MTDFIEVLTDHRNWVPAPGMIFIQQQDAQSITKGGILLPDSAQVPPDAYRVVGVGEGVTHIKPGDFVTAETHCALESELALFAKAKVWLMKAKDVAAVLKPECQPEENADAKSPVQTES